MAHAVPAEVEAKLLVPRGADLRALGRLREVGDLRLVSRGTRRLHTRYLDTADFALARQGVALRVRRSGRHWELTAKWQGSVEGLMHRRPELTVPLAAEPRGRFRLSDPTLHVLLAARIAGRPLRVVLVSDIVRHVLDVLPGDAGDDAAVLAEIALDRVHLHGEGAGPQARYGELEIEQRAGRVADIEALVALLQERFTLEPSAETKFSRGMELLHGFRLPAAATEIGAGDTVVAAARRLCARQLEAMRAHDPGTRVGDDPEALHDLRVAVRRLRAAERAFGDGLPEKLAATLRDDLRWLGRELGVVRDLDVQIARVEAFAAAMPAPLRPGFAGLLGHLRDRRTADRTGMLAALDSDRYFGLLQRLERFADGRTRVPARGAGAAPVAALAAERIGKAFRRLRKQGRAVHGEPTPEQLHELRIRAKRLRYLLEFFGPLAGAPAARAAKRLARLQDLLGDYNDAMTTPGFVQEYVDGPGASVPASALLVLGAVTGAGFARAEALRRRFGRRWRKFAGKGSRRDVEAAIAALREPEPAR